MLELGAGTGELGLRLNRLRVPLDGLDLWPRPADWPREREWHRCDLLGFSGYDAYPVVIANLILHQFTAEELGRLGSRLRRSARVILASEPERRRVSQVMMAAFAPVLGVNHVTNHDARVSIAAGFRGDELPGFLGLAPGEWRFSCRSASFGAIRMVAMRNP